MTRTILQLRQLRSAQPSRSSQAAYAQMDRMRAAALKASTPEPNGGRFIGGALKKDSALVRK